MAHDVVDDYLISRLAAYGFKRITQSVEAEARAINAELVQQLACLLCDRIVTVQLDSRLPVLCQEEQTFVSWVFGIGSCDAR